MKKVFSILLLTIMMVYSFNQLETMINYVSDIEGYTAQFCENTNKPELHCNGKCHLTKELAAQQKQKENKETLTIPEILLFNDFKTVDVEIVKFEDIVDYNYLYRMSFTTRGPNILFHPPRV